MLKPTTQYGFHELFLNYTFVQKSCEWVNGYFVTPIEPFCQLYHGENKLHFADMIMSALYSKMCTYMLYANSLPINIFTLKIKMLISTTR